MANPNKTFWDAHGRVGLVWSNPNASDDVLMAAALLKPDFHLLLDIAAHFGLDRLRTRWERLREDIGSRNYPEEIKQLEGVRPIVERCLANMEEAVCPEKNLQP